MPKSHPKFVAAAVQAAPAYLDIEGTVDKTVDLIAQAAGNGAKLVVFPETWVPGYPYWAWLGAPAWGMQWVQRYFDNSLELDSDDERRIADAARDNEIFVVLGFSERAGGSLYMAQTIYDAEGNRIAARRKLKPTFVERIVFGEGSGGDLQVHDTELGTIGALCCWEHLQPLTKYAMYSMNEQVHAASWPTFTLYPAVYALGAELNDAASQMYAAEGGCFVVAATMPVTTEIIEMLCDTPDKRDLLAPGGGKSMIFGPDGSRLASYLEPDEEGLIYAELDLGIIPLAKAAADPVGHYARPDVTRLLLNDSPARPVERRSAPAATTEEYNGRGFEPVIPEREEDEVAAG